jgi:hypothetical protein
MAQSLANYDAALKNVYGPGLRNALNNSNPVLTQVVRDTENVSGRKCIWSTHSGRSTSTGARKELKALPTADRQRFLAPEEDLTYQYHTIKVSGQAKHLTQNAAGAFGKALDREMKGAERDIKVDLARQMFNQKVTINSALAAGALARIDGAPGANVITLQEVGQSSSVRPDPATYRYFFVGMLIDAVDSSTGAITEAAMEITAIDPVNHTITVDDDGSAANDNYIFRQGNYDATDGEAEINGLPFLLGTQNYATITAASNPVWNGLSVGSSTEGISENLLESGIEAVQVDGNGDSPGLGITSYKQGRKLASIVQQQKRYAPPSTKQTVGWTGVEVAGLDLLFDRFAPERKTFIIEREELAWFVGLDWDWDTDDGKILSKVPGFDAIEAQYKAYVQLNTYNRNSHCTVTHAEPVF